MMFKHKIESIELTWDPDSRIGIVRFESGAKATGKDAEQLVEAMANWIGADRRPFAVLGDGENLKGGDAGYRSVWGGFFKLHREYSYLALYNMKPALHIASEMFGIGTGMHLQVFVSEEEARAWLRSVGIGA
jgi:hypothetical protein